MSKVKIQGNASGTGVVTLTAPNTNTDRTITLPDGTQTLIGADASGNVGIGTSSPSAKAHVTSSSDQLTISEGSLLGATFDYQSSTGALNIGTNGSSARTSPSISVRPAYLGGGITFNGDTAAANALDDYEEGTWSGSLAGTSNPNTTQTIIGTYVKVGRLVTLTCESWGLDATGASGQVSIVGLPFTNGSTGIGASVAAHGTASLSRNIYSQYSSKTDVMPRVAAGTNSAVFYCNNVDSSNYAGVPYIGGSMGNGVIGFTITYPTT